MTRPPKGVRFVHMGGGVMCQVRVQPLWRWQNGKSVKLFQCVDTGELYEERPLPLVQEFRGGLLKEPIS